MSIEPGRKRRKTENSNSTTLSQDSTPSHIVEQNSEKIATEATNKTSANLQHLNGIPNTNKTPQNEDEDWTSSSGSSSEADSDSEPTDPINTTSTQPPTRIPTNTTTNDIHNRLTSFFSQLAEQRANPSLPDESIERGSSDSDSGFEDDDDNGEGEGRQYVELDLALGVLSEQEDNGAGDGEVDGIKLPLPNGRQADLEGESDDGSGDDGEGARGLAELTSITAGKSGVVKRNSKTKTRRLKPKVEELG